MNIASRILPLALLLVFASCDAEESTQSSTLPEVRYYVIADT